MTIGVAANSWVAYAPETVWGTPVAATHFLRFKGESMSLVQDAIRTEAFRAGYQPTVAFSNKHTEGDIIVEPAFQGRELWYHALFGTYTVSDVGTQDWEHLFEYDVDAGAHDFISGLTIEVVRGIEAKAFEYAGCLPTQLVVDAPADGLLTEGL